MNTDYESIYLDGSYLDKTGGTWHLEDAPFKARQTAAMLARHSEIRLDTVCELGCGAGGILAALQKVLPNHIRFTGYEISPQAHALSQQFANPSCRFVDGDAFADPSPSDLGSSWTWWSTWMIYSTFCERQSRKER